MSTIDKLCAGYRNFIGLGSIWNVNICISLDRKDFGSRSTITAVLWNVWLKRKTTDVSSHLFCIENDFMLRTSFTMEGTYINLGAQSPKHDAEVVFAA